MRNQGWGRREREKEKEKERENSPSQSRILYVDQDGLELKKIDLSLLWSAGITGMGHEDLLEITMSKHRGISNARNCFSLRPSPTPHT